MARRETMDAMEYLAGNGARHPFAANRFSDRGEVVAMIRSLREAGASDVRVGGILREPWRLEEQGGPYADTIIVRASRRTAESVEIALWEECPDEVTRRQSKGGGVEITGWWD